MELYIPEWKIWSDWKRGKWWNNWIYSKRASSVVWSRDSLPKEQFPFHVCAEVRTMWVYSLARGCMIPGCMIPGCIILVAWSRGAWSRRCMIPGAWSLVHDPGVHDPGLHDPGGMIPGGMIQGVHDPGVHDSGLHDLVLNWFITNHRILEFLWVHHGLSHINSRQRYVVILHHVTRGSMCSNRLRTMSHEDPCVPINIFVCHTDSKIGQTRSKSTEPFKHRRNPDSVYDQIYRTLPNKYPRSQGVINRQPKWNKEFLGESRPDAVWTAKDQQEMERLLRSPVPDSSILRSADSGLAVENSFFPQTPYSTITKLVSAHVIIMCSWMSQKVIYNYSYHS